MGLGLGLTAVVTAILWLVWGGSAIVPGATFGALATAIQAIAHSVFAPAKDGPLDRFFGRWAAGMGLRFAGVVLVGVAVALDRGHFPPLPTAFGFLGVLLPLLFLELRASR